MLSVVSDALIDSTTNDQVLMRAQSDSNLTDQELSDLYMRLEEYEELGIGSEKSCRLRFAAAEPHSDEKQSITVHGQEAGKA